MLRFRCVQGPSAKLSRMETASRTKTSVTNVALVRFPRQDNDSFDPNSIQSSAKTLAATLKSSLMLVPTPSDTVFSDAPFICAQPPTLPSPAHLFLQESLSLLATHVERDNLHGNISRGERVYISSWNTFSPERQMSEVAFKELRRHLARLLQVGFQIGP